MKAGEWHLCPSHHTGGVLTVARCAPPRPFPPDHDDSETTDGTSPATARSGQRDGGGRPTVRPVVLCLPILSVAAACTADPILTAGPVGIHVLASDQVYIASGDSLTRQPPVTVQVASVQDPDVKRNITRRRLLGASAAAATGGLAGCSSATPYVGKRTEAEKRLTVADETALAVTAEAGAVSIVGEDRDDVHLEYRKKSTAAMVDLSELTLDIRRDNGRLILESRFEGDSPIFGSRPVIDMALRVPRSFAVDRIESSVGDITVENVAGDLTVETTVGDVTIRDVRGHVAVDVTTADVVIDGVDAVGDVSASTGSLDLSVPAIEGDTAFSASTGSIRLALAPDIAADLDANATTGDVTAENLPLEEGRRRESRVTGELNGGGPDLTVTTTAGDISLSRLDAAGG